MKIKRKDLKNPRTKAFIKQKGVCYYCHFPMWNKEPSELLSKFNVSVKNLAKFKCTGEHLTPHSEGGSANQSNIVAACWFCNSKRHLRKSPLGIKQYQVHVDKRLKLNKWNCSIISCR